MTAAKDPDIDLLERLLAAWDRSRDLSLEGAIVRLGRQIARMKGPLDDAVDAEHSKSDVWFECAAAQRAEDVDRLLDTPWPRDGEKLAPRVAAMARFAPDPRIARRFAVLLRSIPSRKRMALIADVMTVIERAATPSVRADLVAALAGRGDNVRDVFVKLIAAVDAVKPSTPSPALVSEAHGRVGDGAELAALWAEHHADPHDLQRRMVLADALAEAGDPRGDLIAVQLATSEGALDRRLVARAKRALAVYTEEWIGPLPLVERDTARFARGFCVGLVTHAGGRDIEATMDRPEWRTLEDLVVQGAVKSPIGKLIRKLDGLRRLEVGRVELPELGADGPYRGIEVVAYAGAWVPTRAMFPDLRVAAGLGPVEPAHRNAIDQKLAAIVHLGTAVETYVQARHAGPTEVRWVGERTAWEPRGWYGRTWRGREDAELVWAGKSRDHGAIVAMLRAMANRGIREIRMCDLAPRSSQEERELARAKDENRSRIAFAMYAPRWDPFAPGSA